jgi:hypoxanthine phosphoribosyltransferase
MSKRRDDLPARVAADFVGFDIEDQFVVGYGLDYGDLYRNLPDVCLLRDLAGGNGR